MARTEKPPIRIKTEETPGEEEVTFSDFMTWLVSERVVGFVWFDGYLYLCWSEEQRKTLEKKCTQERQRRLLHS